MESRRIAVIGGGAWGTALAIHLARRGDDVALWIREPDLVERMRQRRDNPLYLPGIPVPDNVSPEGDLDRAVERATLLLAALPAQHARSVYSRLTAAEDVPLVVATKGIEERSLALPLEVARDALAGSERVRAVLSGPSFAREVAGGRPTAVVIATEPIERAQELQERLGSRRLRLYANDDPVGVQVAGALKNVIAIAAGVADSLEMGANAEAALITRGLAELARLGIALGGRADTFRGLAALGDLVLTCTGDLSRNRSVGQRLGRGERLQDVLAHSSSVAEGVATARSAWALARREGVEMPIVEEVHRILYEEGSPQDALTRLLDRPVTSEIAPEVPRRR